MFNLNLDLTEAENAEIISKSYGPLPERPCYNYEKLRRDILDTRTVEARRRFESYSVVFMALTTSAMFTMFVWAAVNGMLK